MNLLLVDAAEITMAGTVSVSDRRASHLRQVLGAVVGQTVKTGIVEGGIGTATVVSDDGTAIVLALDVPAETRPAWPVELVLAMPRPKVLTRVIEMASSFGVDRIALTNAWRVDKSYLESPRLEDASLAEAVRLGAEQGVHTHLPPVVMHRRFMAMMDSARTGNLLVAHPTAPPIEQVVRALPADRRSGPTVLAIGPEGGWIAREVDTFIARGWSAISIGGSILRVEAAVASLLGQLQLLHREVANAPGS